MMRFKMLGHSHFLVCAALAALLMLAGCPAAAPEARPRATSVPAPTMPAEARAPEEPPPSARPGASPQDGASRAIFRAGLIESEQAVLDGLPGASRYEIALRLSAGLAQAHGRQQVRYTNTEPVPLEAVYFRLFPNATGGAMTVSDVTANGRPAAAALEYADTALRVALAEPLAPGQEVDLALDYVISIPTTLQTGYGLLSYVEDVLALDSPYAAIPIYDGAGWQVETPPDNADLSHFDMSFYRVRVTAPADLVLVATGVEVARAVKGAEQTVTFAAGPVRDFFLAASAAYQAVSFQVGETRINSYAREGALPAARAAGEAAAQALQHFSARFGPYPYTEMDIVSTPLLALGIEYPGITGIALRLYDWEHEGSGQPAQTLLESVVVHEAAHQWFYNLLGSDQVDEPWLDEALAQYATALYYQDRYGASAADRYRASWEARWSRVGRAEIPIGLPAAEYGGQEYGAIVYGRGPFFLDALAGRMGQPAFDRFLADYAAAFRWRTVSRGDFEALAEAACGCILDDLFAAWVDPQ